MVIMGWEDGAISGRRHMTPAEFEKLPIVKGRVAGAGGYRLIARRFWCPKCKTYEVTDGRGHGFTPPTHSCGRSMRPAGKAFDYPGKAHPDRYRTAGEFD